MACWTLHIAKAIGGSSVLHHTVGQDIHHERQLLLREKRALIVVGNRAYHQASLTLCLVLCPLQAGVELHRQDHRPHHQPFSCCALVRSMLREVRSMLCSALLCSEACSGATHHQHCLGLAIALFPSPRHRVLHIQLCLGMPCTAAQTHTHRVGGHSCFDPGRAGSWWWLLTCIPQSHQLRRVGFPPTPGQAPSSSLLCPLHAGA